MKIKRRVPIGKAICIYAVLIPYVLCILGPLLWMLVSSLKSDGEIYSSPWGFPAIPLFKNYPLACVSVQVLVGIKNSIIVTTISVLLTLFVGILAAYIFARFTNRFNNTIFLLIILGLTIPVNTTLIPLFVQLVKLHLTNNLFVLALMQVGCSMPFVVYAFTNHIRTIPKELDEAATIDGCGLFGVFSKIIVPLSKPIVMVLLILQTLSSWNDYLAPVTFISSSSKKTLPVLISNLNGEHSSFIALGFAAMTICMLPMLVVYLIFQRYIKEGITLGAVKG